jgi:hypothetical protein
MTSAVAVRRNGFGMMVRRGQPLADALFQACTLREARVGIRTDE